MYSAHSVEMMSWTKIVQKFSDVKKKTVIAGKRDRIKMKRTFSTH